MTYRVRDWIEWQRTSEWVTPRFPNDAPRPPREDFDPLRDALRGAFELVALRLQRTHPVEYARGIAIRESRNVGHVAPSGARACYKLGNRRPTPDA